jgi:hypothetical protein
MLRLENVPTEKEMLRALKRGDVVLSPLKPTKLESAKNQGIDGVLVLEWLKKSYRFSVECRSAGV